MKANGEIVVPGAAQPQSINVVPVSEVRNALIKVASVMATCQAQMLEQAATIGSMTAIIEYSAKMMATVPLGGSDIDRTMFAGDAEVEAVRQAQGIVAEIVTKLGAAVASPVFTGSLPGQR